MKCKLVLERGSWKHVRRMNTILHMRQRWSEPLFLLLTRSSLKF